MASKKLPTSRRLLADSLKLIKANKQTFLGLLGIYLILILLVVKGFDLSSDIGAIRDNTGKLVIEGAGRIGFAFVLYGYALASSGTYSGPASAYQLFIVLITSLATIWLTRQILAKKAVRLRDGYYLGMHPIIPFIMILFVIGLQLVPAAIGNAALTTVLTNGIAITAIEKLAWVLIFASLLIFSLYLVCSSIFALYISTLPDMSPMMALRSASGLAHRRRLKLGWRIIVLGGFLLLLSIAVVLPLIYVASWAVEPVVLALGGFSLIFFHIYMYLLYRSLL